VFCWCCDEGTESSFEVFLLAQSPLQGLNRRRELELKQSLRLGKISGIPVGLNWGLLVIAFFYMSSLATGFLPSAVPGLGTMSYWLVAGLGVGLFFASILAHELGHSLVAQREGIAVRSITLWLLGGVAELEREADSPGAEFRIAAAGPAVSMLLGVLFLGAGLGYNTLFGSNLVTVMLIWLGVVNGALAVFNLIPAAPLDGGRILTALLWARSGNPYRSRASAARVGQTFGAIMIGIGGLILLSGGGFWILILGWFLATGAAGERRRAELFEAAANASVGEVMTPLASPTDSAVTVSGLLAMGATQSSVAYPVRGADGSIIGIIPGSALRNVNLRREAQTRADQLLVPWDQFVSARTDERLSEVIERFQSATNTHAIVYDSWGNQVGYVGLAELARASGQNSPTPPPPRSLVD
jgi:Zn-dependent protease